MPSREPRRRQSWCCRAAKTERPISGTDRHASRYVTYICSVYIYIYKYRGGAYQHVRYIHRKYLQLYTYIYR